MLSFLSKHRGSPELLILTKSLGYGGVERAVTTLAQELLQEGQSVELGLLEPVCDFPLRKELRECLRCPPGLPAWLGGLPAVLATPFRIAWFVILVQAYILVLRPRRILTSCSHSHIAMAFVFSGTTEWVSWIGSDLSDGVRRAAPNPWMRTHMLNFFSWVYRKPQRTVVPTHSLKRELVKELSLSAERTVVIANHFRSQADRADWQTRRENLVVAVGRLEPIKGFELLVRAVQELPNVRLCLVGEGPERTKLERLSRELGVADRVSITGWVERPEDFLAQAAVVAVPSYREGFCYVLLEAMSTGCCVLSSDCLHGPPEIVGDSGSVRFFPSGDWRALKDSLEVLLADQEERQRLGELAKVRAQEFSLERVLEAYRSFLF